MLTRRMWMKLTAGSTLAGALQASAGTLFNSDRRLVLLILRGGMDGLAAVPAYGDGNYRRVRGQLALPPPGTEQGSLKLDGLFGLHPRFQNLHASFEDRELLIAHAVASPYRDRSHFDGQKVLENGTTDAGGVSGWLNRVLTVQAGASAMAIGTAVPLVLRGPERIASWAPSRLPDADEGTLARIVELYQHDAFFAGRLEEAMTARRMVDDLDMPSARGGRANARQLPMFAEAATRFLLDPDGPRIIVIDGNGWDTHAGQGTVTSALANRFNQLDDALGRLKANSGGAWERTAVLIVTEFGRTVAVNGTGGTDHGTAGVAMLCGGAVNGGRILTDWPGLAQRNLHENRDLRPTIDLRSLLKGVLREHFGIADAVLETDVFPGSRSAIPLEGLIRAA